MNYQQKKTNNVNLMLEINTLFIIIYPETFVFFSVFPYKRYNFIRHVRVDHRH